MSLPGVTVLRVHYSADPEKATPEWLAQQKIGYPEDKWQREMEMNAHAGLGTAIFGPVFDPARHVALIEPIREWPMRHAWDFGQVAPAHVWFQRTPTNGVRIYAARVGHDVLLRAFAESMLAFEINVWGDLFHNRRDYCDPSGNTAKDDGMKSVEILQSFGWRPRWRGSRRQEGEDAIETLLRTHGQFVIDPRWCPELIEAFRFRYRRDEKTGEPVREHPFIDLMDALRYGIIGTKTPERRAAVVNYQQYLNPVSGYGRPPVPGTAPLVGVTTDDGGW